MTELSFQQEARKQMKQGVDNLADAVKVTLGPKGRHVAIRRAPGKAPHITKDGVTVAKSILEFANPYEDMGAQMIKEVAAKTASQAGDGTTTATILAQALIASGIDHLNAGANPVDLKRGIDMAVAVVVKSLQEQSKKVDGDANMIRSIATISANNDSVIGEIVADVMNKVGQHGLITVSDSKTADTYTEIANGLELDRGFISRYFINNEEKRTCDLDNPLILICEKKISSLSDFLHFLEAAAQQKRSLLVIAEDVDSEALYTLIVNKTSKAQKFCAIKSPGFGASKKEFLEDIAILTGATVISDEKGHVTKNMPLSCLGNAAHIVIGDSNAIISGGIGKKEVIDARVRALQQQIQDCTNDYEKPTLERRLAKITNGVAVLYVGAQTDLELKEKKDRIDDALRATRAAIEEGIVPGGGVAYIRALLPLIQAFPGSKSSSEDSVDRGINMIGEALIEPLTHILNNAGKDTKSILERVLVGHETIPSWGYDAKSDTYCSMFDAGIIDPLKVVRVALENAASIAAMFLTTECAIVEKT